MGRLGWLVLLLAALSACALPPRLAEVEGAVVLGPGGGPAGGVWVYWEGPQGAYGARTDGTGAFRLFLPPGPYRAWVEGEGLAGSALLGVQLAPGPQRVGLVAPRAFRPGWPKAPPGLEAEAWTEGGKVRYRARVAPMGGLPPLALRVGLGHPPSALAMGVGETLYLEEVLDTGVRTLDPRGLGGEVLLQLVAYDANQNRTELRFPLSLPQGGGVGEVSGFRAVAYTLTSPLEVLAVGEGYGGLLVRLAWEGSGGPYRLFRDGALLAQLPEGTTAYADLTPGLRPGWRACYRLEAPGGAAAACTTPLPPLRVELLSPAPGARTGPTPLLAWRAEGEGVFFFRPALWDGLGGGGQLFPLTQATEVQAAPLRPGRPYTFELYQAYAVDDPQDPRAYAVAADRTGGLMGLVLAGPSLEFEVGP